MNSFHTGKTLLIVCSLLAGAVFTVRAAGLLEGEYFTSINLWHDRGKPIYSTNYHVGERIPIGSRVSDVREGHNKITFLYNGVLREIIYMPKHTLVPVAAVKSRTFSKTDPLLASNYRKLSEAERKAIDEGRVEIGMTRAAVLMSQGYPPEHKTPSLQEASWIYWNNRFTNFEVFFTNDRVSQIKR